MFCDVVICNSDSNTCSCIGSKNCKKLRIKNTLKIILYKNNISINIKVIVQVLRFRNADPS